MELLTKELKAKFPVWQSTDGKPEGEQKVVAKFFDPASQWTWYAIEFDGEDEFYGLVRGFEEELGYFSLAELLSTRGRFGLVIERDLYWDSNKTLADVRAGRAR